MHDSARCDWFHVDIAAGKTGKDKGDVRMSKHMKWDAGGASLKMHIELEDSAEDIRLALANALTRGMMAIGETAEKYAKEIVPVDTGRLRNSITHEVDTKESAVYIGSNVEYAAPVELGNSRGMRPRPYLRPAATEHTEEYKDIIRDSLENA